MREFVYFSSKATTSGNFRDLKKAGRMDIVCHTVIMSFFVSNAIRGDVKLHLIFYGKPDPPRHLELQITEKNRKFFSKKDISGLIQRMLYKYKRGKRIEAFPSCFIEKKSFLDVAQWLAKKKTVYFLDKKGQDLREARIDKDSVFILGDHEGIPKKEKRVLEKFAKGISLGNVTYFASQSLAILQNELDRRRI
ncbi:MAG: hypothetical protein JSW08_02770 [archaeon]|nr:MAG: hypothetical protein JSW08_02770 [archaeon]